MLLYYINIFAPYRSTSYKYCINALQNAKQSEYIENLEKKLENKLFISQGFGTESFLKFSERITPDKKNYARDLNFQIEEKHKKLEKEKLEKKQTIDF